MSNHQVKPNDGIDAPEIIRTFFLIGIILALSGWFTPAFSIVSSNLSLIGTVICAVGLVLIALGTSMVAYGIRGKFNIRDRMLNQIDWQGDENVFADCMTCVLSTYRKSEFI